MTSVYTQYTKNAFQPTIDAIADDLRLLLVMSNTNAESAASLDAATVGAITTLDHFDGSGYDQAAGLTLTGKQAVVDSVLNKTKLDADDPVVSAMGAGIRNITGAILVKFVTNVASSIPISFHTFATPFNGNGLDTTIEVAALGLLEQKIAA